MSDIDDIWDDDEDRDQFAVTVVDQRERAVEFATAREEIESLRQQLARSNNLLKRVQEACLYTEDDDSIGITQEPHIDSQLFDDICKALAATEPKP